MPTIHNVIKLTAGKITSRDYRYRHICFKVDRKIIEEKDCTTKSQTPEVQLTAKKGCLLTWKICQKAEGRVTSRLMWAGGQVTTKSCSITPFFSWTGKI